jgi:hypothetical protein
MYFVRAMFIMVTLTLLIQTELTAQQQKAGANAKGARSGTGSSKEPVQAQKTASGADSDCCPTEKWNSCQLNEGKGCCVDHSLVYPYYCCSAGTGLVSYVDGNGKRTVASVKAGHLAEVRSGKLVSVPIDRKVNPKRTPEQQK